MLPYKHKRPYLNVKITDPPLKGIVWSRRFNLELSTLISESKIDLFDDIIHQKLDLLQTPEIFLKDDENPECRVLYLEETDELPRLKIIFKFDEKNIILIFVLKSS